MIARDPRFLVLLSRTSESVPSASACSPGCSFGEVKNALHSLGGSIKASPLLGADSPLLSCLSLLSALLYCDSWLQGCPCSRVSVFSEFQKLPGWQLCLRKVGFPLKSEFQFSSLVTEWVDLKAVSRLMEALDPGMYRRSPSRPSLRTSATPWGGG